MGTKRLLNIAVMLCAAVLLAILVLPGSLGPGMRMSAVLVLAILAILYVMLSRVDASSARDLAVQLAGARTEKEEIETRARSIIDGMSDPTVVIDNEHRVSVVNKAAIDALGLDESHTVPCFRALHGLDAPCDAPGHPCVLNTGQSNKTIQTRQDSNGGTRLVEQRTTPLFDDAGNVIGAIEVLHELNEQERLALSLQRASDDAEDANIARQDFVASMSHDVRTPLNAVIGMADLLRLTAMTRKQKTYVQIMQSSSNMLLSLVDNMIDFAEIESGKFELKNEAFRISDLLEAVLSIMGYQAYSKGLELAGMTGQDVELEVTGDFDRLRQILVNLVSNAIKFTHEGEVIVDVSVDRESDGTSCLAVSVADSGIGIPEAELGRLFTPFESASRHTNTTEQGSGLGLAISKRFVDAMGGHISLESEVGKGTTVWFSVPVTNVMALSSTVPDRYESLRSRRLLIVSHNARAAAAVCQFMDDYGLRSDVEPAPHSAESRVTAAIAAGDPYDCILIDVPAKRPDRLWLARTIREGSDIPIILLTSIAQPLKIGEVSSIGHIRAVNKPVLPSELRHNLYRLLEVDVVDPSRSEELVSNSLRILIAEDNPINLKVLEGMLRSLDLEADSVGDGLSVLEALKDTTYDLILMDCQMPGLDGDEVTRIIREEGQGDVGQPVVVAITADVSEGHREKCLAAGMDDFLAKPIRLDTLKTRLRRWAGMSVSRRFQLPASDAGDGDDSFVEQLQERAGLADEAVIGEFIDLFLDDTASRIEVLNTALEARDLKTLRRECHALKGACLELGVTQLGEFCDDLGRASREQRYDDLPPALDRLTVEFNRVRPIFEAGKPKPH
jgi:signal transduction histidine kinase/CheY-like chemotaxis protein/HPt (histidine-containing phosphotransfer) domain-containing protein